MGYIYLSLGLLTLANAVLANPLLEARATCNADNCLRAVTGTEAGPKRPALTSRQADCNSFFAVTVTPDATTTYTTVSADTTTVTVTQSTVPYYASACSGTSRYSSACSCEGATHATTTLATPTITNTVTVTPTATETA